MDEQHIRLVSYKAKLRENKNMAEMQLVITILS